MIEKINALKRRLDALRPLPPEKAKALASVFQAEETEYIFESNAIEGNTLTLAETELVLSKGITVSGKPLKDHLEATNHQKALVRLKELVGERAPIDERTLLDLHDLVLRGINDTYAGRYRDVPVRISGSRHVPPNPLKVPVLMEELFAWFAGHAESAHPVHAAADLHLRLSQIHPFVDGNGRTCRLVMNLHLLKHGYPLTIIRSENNRRVDYYNALAESDSTGRSDAFRGFVELRVLESLERYLAVMEEAAGFE
jgi:Fic family protein